MANLKRSLSDIINRVNSTKEDLLAAYQTTSPPWVRIKMVRMLGERYRDSLSHFKEYGSGRICRVKLSDEIHGEWEVKLINVEKHEVIKMAEIYSQILGDKINILEFEEIETSFRIPPLLNNNT